MDTKQQENQAPKEPEDGINLLEKILPSTSAFFDWALKITFAGIFIFPMLAFLIKEKG